MCPKVSRFREGHGISMKLLSAIVPCYNEEENIADFYHEFIKNEVFFKEKEVELEIWYIDDGSKDGTVSEIKKLFHGILARKQPFMRGSKKQMAIMWYFWMQTYRIRRHFYRKCSGF